MKCEQSFQLESYPPTKEKTHVHNLNAFYIYLNFYKIDWLHEPWLGCQHAGVQDSSCGGDDLSTSSMDSISVQCHIMNVKPSTTDIFLTQNTLGIKCTN